MADRDAPDTPEAPPPVPEGLVGPLGSRPADAPLPPPPPPPLPPPGAGLQPVAPQAPRAAPRAAPRSVPEARTSARRAFDFGGVLSSVFKVYGRMWVSVVLLSLLFVAPGSLLLVKLQSDSLAVAADVPVATAGATQAVLGMNLVQMLMKMVLAGAVSLLVVRYQQGRPIGIGAAIAGGVRRILSYAGVAFWMGLAVAAMALPAVAIVMLGSPGLAVVFFVIAGIAMLLFMLSVFVAAPVCAVENVGALESLRRSRQLSKGHRFSIFGLAFVLWMISLGVMIVAQIPFMAGAAGWLEGPGLGGLLATSAAEILVMGPLAAILPVVIYVELRAVKEGVDPEGIVGVFD